MNIQNISTNMPSEHMFKIIKEVLTLFEIDFIDNKANSIEYKRLNIEITDKINSNLIVDIKINLENQSDELSKEFLKTYTIHEDESSRAAINRVVKLALFELFTKIKGKILAPWGILHGVRPTKIVKRFIDMGYPREKIEQRMKEDFGVSDEKAKLIVDIAYLQEPFFDKSRNPRLISLYIGIPFCPSKCLYCSFPAGLVPQRELLSLYLKTLYYELEKVRYWIEKYDFKIESIYIGGGTPSALPLSDFEELLSYTQKNFWGKYLREFTLEAGRPDTIDFQKAKLMAKYKVNRISINPQTMQDKTLEIIGRKHTAQDIVNAFNFARKAGISHINGDLIIGLPGEGVIDAKDSIERLIALEPEDITLHALALKKGSELKMCYNDILLPSNECVQEMSIEIVRQILDYGLHPYYMYRQGYMRGQLENVGYCRPGLESVYNIQIMGEMQTILGVGGAATSKITKSNKRLYTSFNAKDLHTYLNSIDKYLNKREDLLKLVFS